MRRAAKIVVFNVLATLAILLVLEGASRLIRPVVLPDPLITDRRSDWADTREYDPLLFWTLRPQMRGTMNTNRHGLRGPEILPKSPDDFRILSLGESSTYGDMVLYEETYSSLLEEELPWVDGKHVQVINAGVPGYTLFQGLTYLRLRGLTLNPDAVLVYFGYNDFLPVAFRAQRDAGTQSKNAGLTDRDLFEQRRTLGYRLTYALQKNSNLARLLLFRGGLTGDHEILRSTRARVPEADRRWIVSELRSMARQRGFRLVIVIPWYRTFEKHAPLLRELTTWNDIVVVDLPAKLVDLPAPRASFFHDAAHPNPDGHRLIAQEIGAQLRARWGAD